MRVWTQNASREVQHFWQSLVVPRLHVLGHNSSNNSQYNKHNGHALHASLALKLPQNHLAVLVCLLQWFMVSSIISLSQCFFVLNSHKNETSEQQYWFTFTCMWSAVIVNYFESDTSQSQNRFFSGQNHTRWTQYMESFGRRNLTIQHNP